MGRRRVVAGTARRSWDEGVRETAAPGRAERGGERLLLRGGYINGQETRIRRVVLTRAGEGQVGDTRKRERRGR